VQQTADASTVGATGKDRRMDSLTRRLMAAQADAYDLAADVAGRVKAVVGQFDGKVINKRFHDAVHAVGNTKEDKSAGFWVFSEAAPQYDGNQGLRITVQPPQRYITEEDKAAVTYLPDDSIDIVNPYATYLESGNRLDASYVNGIIDEYIAKNRETASALRGMEDKVDTYIDEAGRLVARAKGLNDAISDDIPRVARDYLKLTLDTHKMTSNYTVESRADYYYKNLPALKAAEGVKEDNGRDRAQASLDTERRDAQATVRGTSAPGKDAKAR
jgi:hypothetical protein